MDKRFHLHILASGRNGTLCVGVTSDLPRRPEEHGTGAVSGFTNRYGAERLVHYEIFDDAENAITREKRLKHWNRA